MAMTPRENNLQHLLPTGWPSTAKGVAFSSITSHKPSGMEAADFQSSLSRALTARTANLCTLTLASTDGMCYDACNLVIGRSGTIHSDDNTYNQALRVC